MPNRKPTSPSRVTRNALTAPRARLGQLPVVADQEVRADAHHLPADQQHEQVVGETTSSIAAVNRRDERGVRRVARVAAAGSRRSRPARRARPTVDQRPSIERGEPVDAQRRRRSATPPVVRLGAGRDRRRARSPQCRDAGEPRAATPGADGRHDAGEPGTGGRRRCPTSERPTSAPTQRQQDGDADAGHEQRPPARRRRRSPVAVGAARRSSSTSMCRCAGRPAARSPGRARSRRRRSR